MSSRTLSDSGAETDSGAVSISETGSGLLVWSFSNSSSGQESAGQEQEHLWREVGCTVLVTTPMCSTFVGDKYKDLRVCCFTKLFTA